MSNHTFDPKAVRRIEVITGVGGRRRWTSEAKARIVTESYSSGLAISEVARRHGIRPQQLFGWRHQARMERLAVNRNVPAAFVPVVAAASSEDVSHSPAASTSSVIEIELAGMIVRVRGRVPAEALAEVLTAVKRVA
jgi:transposase